MPDSKLSQERTRVGVLGGGAWGTALAIHCARMGHDTQLWAMEPEVVQDVNGPKHENTLFLKVTALMHGLCKDQLEHIDLDWLQYDPCWSDVSADLTQIHTQSLPCLLKTP